MSSSSGQRFSWCAGLALVALLMPACGGTGSDGAGDGDDDVGGGLPDAGPCVATGAEQPGDGRDNDCDGVVDELKVCADGSEAFTTIGAAIAAAADGTGVEVCAGTYPERLVVTDKSVRINGAGAGQTILDAGDAGTALDVRGHTVTLAGLTVRRGRTDRDGGAIRCADGGIALLDSAVEASRAAAGGGGLAATRCAVEVSRTRFEGNDGGLSGGAAWFTDSTGVIADSTFAGNAADEGGAVRLDGGRVDVRASQLTGNHARARGGAIYQNSDSTVEDSTISTNTSGWTAGGVYVWQHAPTFRRNTVSGNDTEWEGGGFYLHQSSAVLEENQIIGNTSFDDGGGLRVFESPVRAVRNTIANNKAVDGDGGAFKNSHVPGTYIDNIITGNEALGAGGGIELDNCSSHVQGGVIAGNKASIGGGIHVMLWPWNDGLIEGVEIRDNRAWRGGGLYIENNYQPVTLRQLVIKNNRAHQGAGVYTRGTPLRMSNSIVSGNTAGNTGGAFYVDPSASYPWTKPCPCPPIDPPASVAFVVAHGNTATGGAGVWTAAPGFSVTSSIFTGHTTSAVQVEGGVPVGWRFNNTQPASFVGMADPTGFDGNMANPPGFMAPDSADFHLAAGSVCVDAGDPAVTDRDGSRADMGVYGGPDAP